MQYADHNVEVIDGFHDTKMQNIGDAIEKVVV